MGSTNPVNFRLRVNVRTFLFAAFLLKMDISSMHGMHREYGNNQLEDHDQPLTI